MRGQHTLTSEAIETNFVVNYRGRFALVEALLPSLSADILVNDPSRILVVRVPRKTVPFAIKM